MIRSPATTTTTVARAAIAHLRDLRIDTVFGIPGVHNQALYDALIDATGVRSIVTRHEQGAAFMADGFARVKGSPAACFLITGPGLTNAATAIGEAHADSVPMVCVVTRYADDPSTKGRRLHDLKDQTSLLRALVKHHQRVERPEELLPVLTSAVAAARAGRPGPAAIEVPLEFLDRHAVTDEVGLPPSSAPAAPSVQERDLADAARSIASAVRPLVVLGGGTVDHGAAVRAFVERLGAPVLLTAAAKGVVPSSHPLLVGAWLKSKAVHAELAGADLVIMLGSEWSTTDYGETEDPLGAPVVRVDIDPDARPLSGSTLVADVGEALEALIPRVEGSPHRDGADRARRLREASEREARRWPAVVAQYVGALRRAVEDDAIVAHDMNTLSYAAVEHFASDVPRSFLFPRGYGTLGYAVPAAIGACFAAPGRRVVAVCGDGGALFSLEELATAVRYGLDLTIVIWNNASFGAIRATRSAAYGRSVDDDLVNPDFVALAKAFGAEGVRVDTVPAFEDAVRASIRGVHVIEVDAAQ